VGTSGRHHSHAVDRKFLTCICPAQFPQDQEPLEGGLAEAPVRWAAGHRAHCLLVDDGGRAHRPDFQTVLVPYLRVAVPQLDVASVQKQDRTDLVGRPEDQKQPESACMVLQILCSNFLDSYCAKQVIGVRCNLSLVHLWIQVAHFQFHGKVFTIQCQSHDESNYIGRQHSKHIE